MKIFFVYLFPFIYKYFIDYKHLIALIIEKKIKTSRKKKRF